MEATRTPIMTAGSNSAPLFATPETAEATAAIRALGAARTWGQFFKALPPHIADWGRRGFEDGELPEADEEFDPTGVPGFEDGDFPTSINSTMLHELPARIIERFDCKADTVLNGPAVEFSVEDAQPIVAALREAGYAVFERPELVLEVP